MRVGEFSPVRWSSNRKGRRARLQWGQHGEPAGNKERMLHRGKWMLPCKSIGVGGFKVLCRRGDALDGGWGPVPFLTSPAPHPSLAHRRHRVPYTGHPAILETILTLMPTQFTSLLIPSRVNFSSPRLSGARYPSHTHSASHRRKINPIQI